MYTCKPPPKKNKRRTDIQGPSFIHSRLKLCGHQEATLWRLDLHCHRIMGPAASLLRDDWVEVDAHFRQPDLEALRLERCPQGVSGGGGGGGRGNGQQGQRGLQDERRPGLELLRERPLQEGRRPADAGGGRGGEQLLDLGSVLGCVWGAMKDWMSPRRYRST